MTGKTKISLSSNELELVNNKEWILTKQIIIEKTTRFFSSLSISMEEYIHQKKGNLPVEVTKSNAKISRGENYKGLPYVMLDYPRHFNKESTLAIRTLFWWGNFFSINLQLAGACKERAMPALKAGLLALQQNDYWICVNEDPWQHHFEEDNFKLLKTYNAASFATLLSSKPFIKIAKRISLQQWDDAPVFLDHHFKEMITFLQINYQADERGLSPGIPIAGFDL
ncbi:MAG: hypothetical protein ABIN01_16460 [Ferruginibacter sp.]